MKLYGGIDLHSNNSVLVLIDEEDRVIYEKRLRNDLALILRELASYRKKLTGLVVESTYNWYWLVDGLMEAGYGVHLANTAAIQQYEGLKHSDDQHDAFWLAHLMRLGILPTGYIYPKEERVTAMLEETDLRPHLVHVGSPQCSPQHRRQTADDDPLGGIRLRQARAVAVEQPVIQQAENKQGE